MRGRWATLVYRQAGAFTDEPLGLMVDTMRHKDLPSRFAAKFRSGHPEVVHVEIRCEGHPIWDYRDGREIELPLAPAQQRFRREVGG
jgi:hypothetical protein